MQLVALDVRPFLEALHEIEKECAEQGILCSTSLILRPSGTGALEADFPLTDKQSIAIDFDPDEGDDILEIIGELQKRVRQSFVLS